jgi:hypothetical protein
MAMHDGMLMAVAEPTNLAQAENSTAPVLVTPRPMVTPGCSRYGFLCGSHNRCCTPEIQGGV